MASTTAVPGPRGLPLLGVLPHLARDPLTTCFRAQQEYGDVVRLPVLRGEVFLLTHPDHVERVLVSNNANYWKGRLFRRADFLFGDGLVLNDGESWHRQRRIMQPGFHADRMRAAVPAIESVVERRAQTWRSVQRAGGTVEMEADMTTLTLDLMATAMLGTRLTDAELRDLGEAFGVVLTHLGLRFATFTFPEEVRLPGEARARRALATLDRVVERIVARADPHDDVLELLLAATERGAMTRRLLRDEVITLLFGGYEATAHTLAWTWFELDRNPDVADRVRADEDGTYTRQVIDEILRLYPPFWEILRASREEDRFDEHVLPAGASVLLVPWVTHRRPELWDDPERFDPDRWADGPPVQHRHAYYPFAAGQRMCIGRPLARLEIELVVRRLAQEFRPRLATDRPVRVRAQSTLRSRHGIPMTLERV